MPSIDFSALTSFSRIKSSRFGKMLRSNRSKSAKQPDSAFRADQISQSRSSGTHDEKWGNYKNNFNKEMTPDYSEPENNKIFEERFINDSRKSFESDTYNGWVKTNNEEGNPKKADPLASEVHAAATSDPGHNDLDAHAYEAASNHGSLTSESTLLDIETATSKASSFTSNHSSRNGFDYMFSDAQEPHSLLPNDAHSMDYSRFVNRAFQSQKDIFATTKSNIHAQPKTEHLTPWERQGHKFELQRVMQSIPLSILKRYP